MRVCWECAPRAFVATAIAALAAYFFKLKTVWIITIALVVLFFLLPVREPNATP